MPYLPNKFLRIISIIILLSALAGLCGYLKWVSDSGTVVATALPAKSAMSAGILSDRPMSNVVTRQQTITFAPIDLNPSMGNVRLEIELKQIGLIKNEDGMAAQTFVLTDAATGKEAFRTQSRGLIQIPKDADNVQISFKVRTWDKIIGETQVPQAGLYVLTATMEQWLLASSNISMKLVAKTGTVSADFKVVVGLFGALVTAILLLWLTTPPEFRKTKKASHKTQIH